MHRPERFARNVQLDAFEKLFQAEANEQRPDDAPVRAGESEAHYAAWNATSFSGYVPFRGPVNG